MVKHLQRLISVSATVAFASLMLVVTSAYAVSPFPLRTTQVPFAFAPLQGYLNLVDSGITVGTDQLEAQTWSVSITGNADFTLMLRNGGGVASEIGVYNGADLAPLLLPIFPAGAVPGWYAPLHFAGGSLTVDTFNQNSVHQGQVTYPGVNQNNFGFYIKTASAAVRYSQDARNPGAQAVTYASNTTPGDYWECFEASPYAAATSTFDGVVLNLQSVRPTPARRSSWGMIKASYR